MDEIIQDQELINASTSFYCDAEISTYYLDILEKTNQQLSLWFNPYGIAIGILAILFAVMAIFVSGIFFMHSQEQKKKVEEQMKKHDEHLEKIRETIQSTADEQMKENQEKYEKHQEMLKKEIVRAKSKILELKASAKDEKEIARLEDRVNQLEITQIQAPVTARESVLLSSIYNDSGGLSFANNYDERYCTRCGHYYKVSTEGGSMSSMLSYLPITGQRKYHCPKCGNSDIE